MLGLFNIGYSELIARLIVILTAIPIHEFAHGYAAYKMGDDTARLSNRLTLNPMHHIDPVGTLMILLFGFGFAKPVPVNSLRFTRRRRGIIITSLAGPVSNILLALVSILLMKLLLVVYAITGMEFFSGIITIFNFMVSINLTLAVFNLIPIPPLDGWHVLVTLMPYDAYRKIAPYEQYMIWGVLLLAWMGALSPIIRFFVIPMWNLLDKLTFFVDLLFRLVM